MDIIVTTPKTEIQKAAQEAADAIAGKVDIYFRSFRLLPNNLNIGDKIFYIENGFITGYAIVCEIEKNGLGNTCMTTGKTWFNHLIRMKCDSWNWIKPIPMKGFQGFRYTPADFKYELAGNWLTPKP